ncbi:MAG: 3-isopropylmalate dehydratase [Candidatus Omnitrophota bacterium]
MILVGQARRLKMDDDINTDYIISGRYKFHISDPKELAKHIFEDLEENFIGRVKEGDFVVSGKNFGCGSSREQAPLALKVAGIKAVVAKSFARIFYRNAFNLGLLLIEADTDLIKDADKVRINLDEGKIIRVENNTEIAFNPLPSFAQKLLNEGGVINYFKKYGRLDADA